MMVSVHARSTPDNRLRTHGEDFPPCPALWTITGSRSIFYAIWILSQVLLFGLAVVHYALKDNLTAARAVFGGSYG